MTFETIFSPFLYKVNLNNNDFLKEKVIPQITKKKKKSRSLVPVGWFSDVFSSYRYDNDDKTVYNGSEYLNGEESKKFYDDFDNTSLMRSYINVVSDFLQDFALINNSNNSVSSFNLDMWYNAYARDQYQEWHSHSGGLADFSAIHYLKFDKSLHSATGFRNPISKSRIFSSLKNAERIKSIKNGLYTEVYYPNVKEGDLIIFPSWLEHICPPNRSNKLRVTVAFNIELL
jgi:uncharacterized protein (TIGR02466 family)